jgi:hypothetical protein
MSMKHSNDTIGNRSRDHPACLRLLCGAGGYPPNVLQHTEAYCTNPALVSPLISRGSPHQMT